MLTSQRKAHILGTLRREGRVVAKEMAASLELSEDTIRRDLRELAAAGELQRVHGGALPASPAIATFTKRLGINSNGKVEIGRIAASMVRPNAIVMIDGGTTAIQMARHLPKNLKATVITHSPSVAVELLEHSEIEVILIGGRLYKHSVVNVGATALAAIEQMRADIFFMGVTGVHAETGLTTGDFEEAAIKRAFSNAAAETIVLASAEKIGAASSFQIIPLRAASIVITEPHLDPAVLRSLESSGVTVVTR